MTAYEQSVPSGTVPQTTTGDPRSSDWNRILFIVAAVAAIVLFLILFRSCSSMRSAIINLAGGKPSIVSVPALPPDPYCVSIWVKPDADVERVLSRHGLSAAGCISLGGGTYVVPTGGRSAAALVHELKQDPGLVDAGRVYVSGTNQPRPEGR